jgi:hypothetical protein
MTGFAYSFTSSKNFSGPAYPTVRESLNWARGSILHVVQMSGKWTEHKGGFIAEEMTPVVAEDATQMLQNFARLSARAGLKTFSGKLLTDQVQGLYTWVNQGKISFPFWEVILRWAEENELLWMNGGHVEAALCNAVLTHVREPHYHAWLSGQHVKMQFGKAEIARQEKSLQMGVSKLFGAKL